MMLQDPLPPVPPIPPAHPFDPNLIFLQDGGPGFILMMVIAGLAAATIILWPVVRALARRLEGKGSGDFRLEGGGGPAANAIG